MASNGLRVKVSDPDPIKQRGHRLVWVQPVDAPLFSTLTLHKPLVSILIILYNSMQQFPNKE